MPPSTFDASTTAETVAAYYGAEIKGKVVLVTGTTIGGLGFEAARVIALHEPKLLILAGRTQASLDASAAALPTKAVRTLLVDFSSLASARAAAKEVLAYPESIDVLMLNAGVMACPYSTTVDGFETQFGTNHLVPFLFANLIRSKVVGRVVVVSSWGHHFSDINWDDVGFAGGKTYDKWKGYGQSKTANILFGLGIVKHWGIPAYSLHPGAIWTNLGRHLSKDDMIAMGFIDETGATIPGKQTWKTIEGGAATHIVASFDTDILQTPGAYLVDCQVATTDEAIQPHAIDKESAEKLWVLSEKLVGEKF